MFSLFPLTFTPLPVFSLFSPSFSFCLFSPPPLSLSFLPPSSLLPFLFTSFSFSPSSSSGQLLSSAFFSTSPSAPKETAETAEHLMFAGVKTYRFVVVHADCDSVLFRSVSC